MKLAIALVAVTALSAGSLVASGQEYETAVSLPGVTGATTYNAVPQGFDPVYASQQQLQEYGFPNRPDPNDTKPYADWLRAVSVTRITPQLVPDQSIPPAQPAPHQGCDGRQHLQEHFRQLERMVFDGGSPVLTKWLAFGWFPASAPSPSRSTDICRSGSESMATASVMT